MRKIVFLDRDTLGQQISLASPAFPHEWISYGKTRADEVAARVADADIIVTNKAPLTGDVLRSLKKLRFVAIAATGTNIVDIGACAERGIPVSNIRDYAGITLPEHVFTLILALRRSLMPYIASVKAGRWQEADQYCYFDYPIADLRGATLGIVGRGDLGTAVAKLAEAFGMKVLFAARKGAAEVLPPYTSFDEVLRTSDVLSLHCPLTPQTRGLIGAAEFAQMARKPVLINTARGGLVDIEALGEALRSGRIAGAGFDVAEREPPPPDDPLMQLLGAPNFILTPHVAWASREAVQALADQLIANIEAFEAGHPRNLVKPD